MAKLKILCEEKIKKINLKKTAKAVYEVLNQKDKFVAELVFMSEDQIRETNRTQRNIDSVTDVLSFPTLDGVRGKTLSAEDFPADCVNKRIFLGSIAICEKRAVEQANDYGHSREREITYLLVHGLLHLFNYDHEKEEDKAEMRTLEKKIMTKLNMERVL